MYELKHYAHCVAQNTYHLEWATKYRDDRFRSFYRRKLCEAALRQAAHKHNIRIISLRVLIDHVHVFVELRPSMSSSKAVALLKGSSSRILRKNVKHFRDEKVWCRHFWSPGKFVRSVGNVTADTIERYIAMSARNQSMLQRTLDVYGAREEKPRPLGRGVSH